jgi:hypothetical protein
MQEGFLTTASIQQRKTVKAASYGQPGEMDIFSTNTHRPPQSINHEHQAYIPTRSFSSPLEMIGD